MKLKLFALLCLVAFTHPSQSADPCPDAKSADKPRACCPPVEAAKPTLPDASLYQTASLWKTDTGREIKLAALAGRPQVVAMFFSTCQFTCPVIVNDLKRIEAALSAELRGKVGITLVSFDSRRDTPLVLAEFRSTRQLSTEWNLLTGQPDDILELALLLGVKYKETAPGQFAHSNSLTLLDANGLIAYQQNGLNQDPSEMIKALRRL